MRPPARRSSIAPRHCQRRGRHVGAGDAPGGPFVRQRDGDGAGARAEIGNFALRRAARDAGRARTSSSVSGRGTSTAGVTSKSATRTRACPEDRPPGTPAARRAHIAAKRAATSADTGSPARASSCVRVRDHAVGEQDLGVAAVDIARCAVPAGASLSGVVRHAAAMMHEFRVASVSCPHEPRALPVSTGRAVPLPRPLMTGEVLDAAFRLFRAGLAALPAVLGPGRARARAAHAVRHVPVDRDVAFGLAARLAGWSRPGLTEPHRVADLPAARRALARRDHVCACTRLRAGQRPRFRAEIGHRPAALAARPSSPPSAPSSFRCCCTGRRRCSTRCSRSEAADGPGAAAVLADGAVRRGIAGVLVRRPRAVRRDRASGADFAAALVAHGRRDPRDDVHRRWCSYVLAADLRRRCCRRMLGRADLFLIATVRSLLYLVVGAFGVPFVLAVLIVAYQDLKLREQRAARGAAVKRRLLLRACCSLSRPAPPCWRRRCGAARRSTPAARGSMRAATSASSASSGAARNCFPRWRRRPGATCCRARLRERREEISAESLRALGELVARSRAIAEARRAAPDQETWRRCWPSSANGTAGRDALGALQALAQGETRRARRTTTKPAGWKS